MKTTVGESKLTPAELAALTAACLLVQAGGIILEVGTFHGATAARLADACPDATVLSLDVFRSAKVDPSFWFQNRRPNMTLFVGTAQQLWASGEHRLALIFIDAMHTREAVLGDLWAAQRMLAHGGRVFCHDYTQKWAGVVQGIDEFTAPGGRWKRGALVDSLIEIVPA